MEVTSNIWGTKFKIHGLVNSVPANLGQVTYKTSLLHLQPRQMTLVMTELRDDFPTGPDPNFNPNLFSEDEEDINLLEERVKLHRVAVDNCPPIAPMSPRCNRINRPKSQTSNHFVTPEATIASTIANVPALARAESYEDEIVFHNIGDVVGYCEGIRPQCSYGHIANATNGRPTNSIQSTSFMGQYCRTNSANSGNQRHAISPLCCEGSVPALQSPKNAVAPSDIIFDRPPAQTLLSYSTTDYNNTSNNVQQVKTNILNEHVNKNGISLNLNCEPRKPVMVKKDILESATKIGGANKCSSDSENVNFKPTLNFNLRNNTLETNKTREGMSFINKALENCNSKCATSDKLKFIDEENNEEAKPGSSQGITSTPYLTDSMIRSCSVGYLDLVDVHLVPSEVALQMLGKDAPKRLVLVNQKTKQRKLKKPMQENKSARQNRLKNCGKSKSLDSSDIFPPCDAQNIRNLANQIEEAIPEIENNNCSTPKSPAKAPASPAKTVEEVASPKPKCKRDNSKLNFFITKSPLMKRKKSENTSNNQLISSAEKSPKNRGRSKQKASTQSRNELGISEIETNSRVNNAPLHTHALATLESLITRLKDDNRVTPPSSPRLPRSSPASPAPTKKGACAN